MTDPLDCWWLRDPREVRAERRAAMKRKAEAEFLAVLENLPQAVREAFLLRKLYCRPRVEH